MPGLPAQCTRCGLAFEGRGIFVGNNVQHLAVSGNTESCPRCGGRARIVEGTFSVRDGVVEVLRAASHDKQLLERFAAIAHDAREGTLPVDDAVDRIAADVPELGRVLQRVPPKARKAFIWVLLTAISILAAQAIAEWRDQSVTPGQLERALEHQKGLIERDVERAVERALTEHERRRPDRKAVRRGPKIGRNDPCPCGSTLKHKKCCGR